MREVTTLKVLKTGRKIVRFEDEETGQNAYLIITSNKEISVLDTPFQHDDEIFEMSNEEIIEAYKLFKKGNIEF